MSSTTNGTLQVVRRELLEALAGQAPARRRRRRAATARPTAQHAANGSTTYEHRLKVPEWLRDRGRDYRVKQESDGRGRTVYPIDCPFDPSHRAPMPASCRTPTARLRQVPPCLLCRSRVAGV